MVMPAHDDLFFDGERSQRCERLFAAAEDRDESALPRGLGDEF
jgi:hypothetical protein